MTRPIRVLHVVGAMNRGGVEAWSRGAAPALSGSPFDIAVSAQTLLESYRHAPARRGARRRTRGASRKHVPVGIRASVGDDPAAKRLRRRSSRCSIFD